MKKESILFAKAVLYLVAGASLAVCIILLPELAREEAVGKPVNHLVTYGLVGCYVLATPFFIGLYQTFKLLGYIEKNNVFSVQAIKALQNIKRCAIVFSILVVIAVITAISLAQGADPTEDVTFMVTFGFLFTSVSVVVAVFVAVLQKLLRDAVDMKSENDLIV